jgi:5'-3' exonuclease
MMMKALIDGDIVVYSIGYASENDPVEAAYERVDGVITNIILATGATDYSVYLSDSSENSFRHQIYPQYKANRTQPKPIWYNEIKEYLMDKHEAKVAYGMEADDSLGINQEYPIYWRELDDEGNQVVTYETVLCTIDKDLDMLPGLHYSWPIIRKGEVVREAKLYEVDYDTGLRHFWKQVITGDRTDNIFGIEGMGDKKADKFMADIPTESLHDAIRELYSDDERFYLNCNLLWIMRKEGETFTEWMKNNEGSSSL